MPKKYKGKKTQKRTGRKKAPRATSTKGIGGNTQNFNVLNTVKPTIYKFKDTINYNDIVGTGSSVVGVNQFDIGMVGRYNALIVMFKRYRITLAKVRFRLRTIELTDQAQHPMMLLRFNYDPDLTVGSVSENSMLRQMNVIQKQFIHNTPEGATLEYTIKPAVMGTRYQFNSSTLVKPTPLFNQWCDFTTISNAEIGHYGLQYFISNLPTGQVIDMDLQLNYECCDLV